MRALKLTVERIVLRLQDVLDAARSAVDRARAFLLASPGPVRVAELAERFGRGRLPPEVVYVERGVVTLPARIEGFELWRDRLVPACERIMATRDPSLQWMTSDLLEALEETVTRPPWLGPWLLAGIMRNSGRFEDLGRMRFALRAGDGAEVDRVRFMPATLPWQVIAQDEQSP